MPFHTSRRGITSPGSAVALLSALIIVLSFLQARAAHAWDVTGDRYILSDRFEYFEDPVGALGIHHILADPEQYPFVSSRESKPTGFYSPVWLKLSLQFDPGAPDRHYVLVSHSDNFSDIRIYRPDAHGRYHERITGNDYVASSRELESPRYAFDIAASAEPIDIYLRYVGDVDTSQLPWYLVEENSYQEGSHKYYLVDIACYAAILALLLFNVILAGAIRKAAYAYYSAFVVSVFMALVTYEGIGFYYLWPNMPELNERLLHTFNLLSAGFRILAVVFFLDIAKCAPGWHRAAVAILGTLGVTLLVVLLVGISALPPYAATVPWAVANFFGFAICIVGIVKGQRLAVLLFLTLLVPSIALAMQTFFPFTGQEAELWSEHLAKIGFVVHVILWSVCLAAQIRHQTESHRIALHDNLTGLPQAALLRDRFEWAAGLAKRQQWRMAILFIDLDGFKAVNDSLGHAAGDRVLLEVAARMRGAVRKSDYVARLGGDEFVILLVDVPSRNSIVSVTKGLLNSIAQPILLEHGRKASVSASIGVSIYNGEDRGFPELVQEADAAMYEAKRRGKNTYAIAGEAANLRLVESRLTLVTQ